MQPPKPAPLNRLSREKSPYLLQHAHNPVDWYPWSTEAFDKARQEQKPVLLSVGYSTCHWCHVMAHESFENEEIAAVINDKFVAIKVDREERPDIDHIYMTAVTAMTGQGGWPLTAFLTPEAKPFYGGTYFPPFAKWGAPGFKDLLQTIAQAWEKDREGIVASSHEITESLQEAGKSNGPRTQLDSAILDRAFERLSAQFDPRYGGFGHAPKFPMGHNLSFLLRYAGAEAVGLVEQTLKAMAQGGIYDHLGGGFHRYSTDRVWHVPHFEKMLYDQALLALAYAEGYQAAGNEAYGRTAKETLDYVLRDLTSPDGGFYCAEDADSEGHEGTFYIWTRQEIEAVLGKEQAEVFNRYYGVQAGGNAANDPHGEFTGKNILFLAQEISDSDRAAMEEARKKLFDHRSRRPRPHLDDKVLTDWNGLMIAALAFSGVVLAQPRYTDAARRAADFILARLNTSKGLLHRWRDGEASIDGMLEDYAFFLFGLVHLYEATFEQRYLDAATILAGRMNALFADPEGGFFMTAAQAPGLILRPQEVYDGALPSGNSAAGYALVKLHYLTGAEEYMRQAQALFERFMPAVARAPQAHAFFLGALDLYLKPTVEITVEGKAEDAAIANIRKVVYKRFIPCKVFKRLAGAKAWSVTVCREGTCSLPVADLSSLEQMIIKGTP